MCRKILLSYAMINGVTEISFSVYRCYEFLFEETTDHRNQPQLLYFFMRMQFPLTNDLVR